jgi:hypothetical protein
VCCFAVCPPPSLLLLNTAASMALKIEFMTCFPTKVFKCNAILCGNRLLFRVSRGPYAFLHNLGYTRVLERLHSRCIFGKRGHTLTNGLQTDGHTMKTANVRRGTTWPGYPLFLSALENHSQTGIFPALSIYFDDVCTLLSAPGIVLFFQDLSVANQFRGRFCSLRS